jgi:hypothetical protein
MEKQIYDYNLRHSSASGKEEKPQTSFGVKHSQYAGALKVVTHSLLFNIYLLQGDAYVRARTETVKMPVQIQEEFRPR